MQAIKSLYDILKASADGPEMELRRMMDDPRWTAREDRRALLHDVDTLPETYRAQFPNITRFRAGLYNMLEMPANTERKRRADLELYRSHGCEPKSATKEANVLMKLGIRHRQPTEKWDTTESEAAGVYREFKNQMLAQQMGTTGHFVYTTFSPDLEEKRRDREERLRVAEFEISSTKFMEEMRARNSEGRVATWYGAARPVPSPVVLRRLKKFRSSIPAEDRPYPQFFDDLRIDNEDFYHYALTLTEGKPEAKKVDQALRILYQRYAMADLKQAEDIVTYSIPCHRGANEEEHAQLIHVPGAATREDVVEIANMFEGTAEERAARLAQIVLGSPDTNQDLSDLISMAFDPGLRCAKEGRMCYGNTDKESPEGAALMLYESMHENLDHCHPMVQAIHMMARMPDDIRPAPLYHAMHCGQAFSNCRRCQENNPTESYNNRLWILNAYCQLNLAQMSAPAYLEFTIRDKEYRQERGLPARAEAGPPDGDDGADPAPMAISEDELSDEEVEVVTVLQNSRSPSPAPLPEITLTMHHGSLPPSPCPDLETAPNQDPPTAPTTKEDDLLELKLDPGERAEVLQPEED